MKKGIVWLCGFLLVSSAQAGLYTQDFNSAANLSTDLGDGTTITSTTGHAQVYDTGSWKALRLTQDQVAGQTANFALYDLDAGGAITSFTSSFDSLIKGGADPADGFSFNFGTLPVLPDGGEMGMSGGSMLSIGWDTYAGGGRGIEVFVNGSSVSRSGVQPILQPDINQAFTRATITWDETGLDVIYNGASVFTDLDVSGFTASAGDRFAFAARTGAAYEDVFIDNVNVATIPEPAVVGLVTLFGGSILFVRRIFPT